MQSAGAGGVLNSLPVSLRYTLNGLDFLAAHEERYYPTVGSDDWGLNPFALIEQVFKDLGAQLSKHSAIISAADISFETTTGRGEHTVRSSRMLKKSASFVLASLRGSTYRKGTLRLFARCGRAGRPF